MEATIEAAKQALAITAFVFVMMLVIEYLNVLTTGSWQERLARRTWGQYIVAALLGAVPGCLGAFAVVTMYSHGILSIGAVIATMIATSGDEAFVMLAMFPRQALLLTTGLFILGVAAGAVTDLLTRGRIARPLASCNGFAVHVDEPCTCFAPDQIVDQWRHCSAARGILAVGLAAFVWAVLLAQVGPTSWNWLRITLLVLAGAALFMVCTVPDHFLEHHLWEHVARKHIPRVFMWTLGALVTIHLLTESFELATALEKGKWVLLLIACLVGLIPESGPHLVFVTLYAQGAVPLSILFANSIVQDGHGMLPMLAHSRRAFVGIKAVNFAVGLLCGAVAMALGV